MIRINHNLPPVSGVPTFGSIAVGTMFTVVGNPTRTFRKLRRPGKHSNATECVSHPEFGDGNFRSAFEIKHIVTRVEFHYD